ncbi:hypothetical protein ABPG74_020622, partial [Tetrahymena malaccensis]
VSLFQIDEKNSQQKQDNQLDHKLVHQSFKGKNYSLYSVKASSNQGISNQKTYVQKHKQIYKNARCQNIQVRIFQLLLSQSDDKKSVLFKSQVITDKVLVKYQFQVALATDPDNLFQDYNRNNQLLIQPNSVYYNLMRICEAKNSFQLVHR